MTFDDLPLSCIDCGGRHAAQSRCSACNADGPLMDLRDPNVRAELVGEDDRARTKRRYLMIWPAVPFAAVITWLLGCGVLGFVAGGAAGYGISLLLLKLFPAKQRFPYLKA